MRSTRVVTVDGKMLAIPNSQIVNSSVASYTNFPNLRLDVDFTVAVTENLGRIRALLLEMVEDDERFLAEPEPTVVVTALNDYNVAMCLRVWLEDERKHITVRFEVREKLFETLREAGVDMPYETFAFTPVQIEKRFDEAS
jgi:small conductance mechanosensitive channel